MTTGTTSEWVPDWSPDGQSIAFSSRRGGSSDIWVISAEGGEANQVTVGHAASFPVWPPDGRSIVFYSDRGGGYGLWQVPAHGGDPERLTQSSRQRPAFSPDGRRMYFAREDNLWMFSLPDGTERQVTDLEGRYGELSGINLDTDGEHIYFQWLEDEGDIWVADLMFDERSDHFESVEQDR